MTVKKQSIVEKPIYSQRKVEQITRRLQDSVREVMRLQAEGKLPYASRVPRINLDRDDIMDMLGVKYDQAGKIMTAIRKKRELKPRQYITIEDAALALEIKPHIVQRFFDMRFGAHRDKRK